MLIILFVSLLVMFLGVLVSLKLVSDEEKNSLFECGFDSFLMARVPFSLRFFKLALIFIFFDVEIILLLVLPYVSNTVSMMVVNNFICVMLLIFGGLMFEWQQNSLNWL